MAGARDIKRATIIARREQAERNRQAIEERNARLQQLDQHREMSPSDRRRAIQQGKFDHSTGAVKMAGGAPENKALGGPGSNKSDEDGDDVDPLTGIAFASPQAEQLAREAELTFKDFSGYEPSKSSGYGSSDVKQIIEDLAEEEEDDEELEEEDEEDED
jgi:hypothetical protein